MAEFKIDGFDRLQVSIADMAMTPPETVLTEVILPAAEAMVEAMCDSINSYGLILSRWLLGSIKILTRYAGAKGVWADVGPDQGRHPKSTQGLRKPRAQGGRGGHYSGTNAEVGFILEYGTSRIPAYHWMEQAVRNVTDDIYDLMASGWYAILERRWAA